jgi:hypothetical protein
MASSRWRCLVALDDEWNDEAEARYALALVPLVKEVMNFCRGKFPPDTHFGVMVLVKPVPGQEYGRVVAMTTDRQVVAPAVAQWTIQVMRGEHG